jgi:Protein of unknown function (DUF3043)
MRSPDPPFVHDKVPHRQVHAGPKVVPKYPGGVSLLGRRKGTAEEAGAAAEPADEPTSPGKTTAPKGRPTPRRDVKRRGPVPPAPMTAGEARRRRRDNKLTRAERREVKAAQRQSMADRRERMMAGEEGHLLPRDKGPERRYVRDVVDSSRNLLGLFMPLAFGLILLSFASPPRIAVLLSYGMVALVPIMLIAAFMLGRRINKLVDQKFPKNTESGWRLGLYAASRASQLRRMRTPRPQVQRGDKVT